MSPPSGWLASSAVYWHVTGIGRLERDRWRHLLCEDLSRLNLCAPLCQYGQIIDGGLNKRRIPAPFPQLLPETWNFSFLRTRREKKLSLLAFISYARNQQSWRLNSSLCTHLRDSYLLNSNSLWELRDKRIRSRVVKKTNNYCIERCIKTFITSLDFFFYVRYVNVLTGSKYQTVFMSILIPQSSSSSKRIHLRSIIASRKKKPTTEHIIPIIKVERGSRTFFFFLSSWIDPSLFAVRSPKLDIKCIYAYPLHFPSHVNKELLLHGTFTCLLSCSWSLSHKPPSFAEKKILTLAPLTRFNTTLELYRAIYIAYTHR